MPKSQGAEIPEDRRDFDFRLLAEVNAIRRIGRGALRRSRDDIDDLVQEVLLRAYLHRESLREPDKLPEWVASIARNTARDWGRRRQPLLTDAMPDLPSSARSPLDELEQRERWEALLEAVRRLGADERELLLSRVVDEESYEALQAEHGLSYAAVTSRIHRARRRVLRQLGAFITALAAGHLSPKPRAFGQIPRTTMSQPSVLAAITGVSALVIGGVAVGIYIQSDAAVTDTGERSIAVEAVSLGEHETVKPIALESILDRIRHFDAALTSYTTSFKKTVRRSVQGAPGQFDVEIHEGTIRSRDEYMAVQVDIVKHRTDGTITWQDKSEKTDLVTDGELVALKWYYPNGNVDTSISEGTLGNMQPYRVLESLEPGRMHIADYLEDRSHDPEKRLAVTETVMGGDTLYHVKVTENDGVGRTELYINPARGFRIQRMIRLGPGWGYVTDADVRHDLGDVWYPARVTVRNYDADSGTAGARYFNETELTQFRGGVPIPDEVFALVPKRGNAFYDDARPTWSTTHKSSR